MTAVIWNPTIGKSVAIDVPHVLDKEETVIGFGVWHHTSDPKLVKINDTSHSSEWQVEVFTLSSVVWRSPHMNLPNESIMFTSIQVNIDGFIYWLSYDTSESDEHWLSLIMSFDMTSEEFTEVSLPYHLADNIDNDLTIFF
ncbi:putative F-box domain-containing protein [Tanacetum coccineum]